MERFTSAQRFISKVAFPMHKQKLPSGFTRRYGVAKLVWYEPFDDIHQARDREHAMKRWRRAWKLRLIEESNPDWVDLAEDWNLS